MPRSMFNGVSAILRICGLLLLRTPVQASTHEEKLLATLFRGYHSLIRPARAGDTNATVVNMGLQLVLLINLDELNQIMHTNVWLTLTWHDFQMVWDPDQYAGIKMIRVPNTKVWLPDVVLFNNADGNYEVTFPSNVVITHDGTMLWVPPSIYKSSCTIDVQHFPFDQQICEMTFGSWTFNYEEVQLAFNQGKQAVDVSQYYKSSIWDLMDCGGVLKQNGSRLEYKLILRRKPLFYTVVLIIPTVLMAFLSMMVFYLPADAGEKITLALSILLSLVVFMLLITKILPATSIHIPLMAKYLLLVFVLNVVTILVTVIVVNIFYRSPSTHEMPNWMRVVFLQVLARLLMMKRPRRLRLSVPKIEAMEPLLNPPPKRPSSPQSHHPHCPLGDGEPSPGRSSSNLSERDMRDLSRKRQSIPGLSSESLCAIQSIEYIAEHLKQEGELKRHRDDWKYVATVIDRMLMYIFFGTIIGGTAAIMFSAPDIFDKVDQAKQIEILNVKYPGNPT